MKRSASTRPDTGPATRAVVTPWAALATRKLRYAERLEARAAAQRVEAAEFQRRWEDYLAQRAATGAD
jgi:hypothetical protein